MTHACVPAYAGRDMPAIIQRAISRLMDPEFPVQLPAAEKVALAALLRRVEARDGQATFWVLRANLAELFGKVERTITNWLNGLETKGLIEKEQRRSRWGNFRCINVHLTDLAADLLGLRERTLPSPRIDPLRKEISAGHIKGFTKEQSLQRQLDTRPLAVDKSNRVPQDCRMLLDLGIKPSGVFALMAEATKLGQRLGDVITARQKVLREAKAPFGLIRMLLRSPKDFAKESSQVRRRNSDLADKAALSAKKAQLHDQRVEMKGGLVALCKKDDVITVSRVVDGRTEYAFTLAGAPLLAFWFDAVERDLQPLVWPVASYVSGSRAPGVMPSRALARLPAGTA